MEICFSSLKRVFGLSETLAETLVGLVTRIAATKMAAYTYGFYYVNRLLGRGRRGGSRSAGADQGAMDLISQ